MTRELSELYHEMLSQFWSFQDVRREPKEAQEFERAAKSGNRPRFKPRLNLCLYKTQDLPSGQISVSNYKRNKKISQLEEEATMILLLRDGYEIHEAKRALEGKKQKQRQKVKEKKTIKLKLNSLIKLRDIKQLITFSMVMIIALISINLPFCVYSDNKQVLTRSTSKLPSNVLELDGFFDRKKEVYHKQKSDFLIKHKRQIATTADSTTNLQANQNLNQQPNKKLYSNYLTTKQIDDEMLKIAALASKLEQWFSCHKKKSIFFLDSTSTDEKPQDSSSQINSQTQINTHKESHLDHPSSNEPINLVINPNSGSLNTSGDRHIYCEPHFDNHLCWPAAKAGELVRLPCPSLRWLPSQPSLKLNSVTTNLSKQDKQLVNQSNVKTNKAVINSTTTTTTIERAPKNRINRQVNSSLESIIKPEEGLIVEDQVNAPPKRFAYRECLVSPIQTKTLSQIQSKDGKEVDKRNIEQELADNKANSTSQSIILAGHWAELANYSECYQNQLLLDNADSEQLDKAENSASSTSFDPTDKWIKLREDSADQKLFLNLAQELERIDGAIEPYSDPDLLEQWSFCIGNIMRHQQAISRQGDSPSQTGSNSSDLSCPIIFDGWRCWPSTKAGQVAYVGCPKNLPGFMAEREAHKICTSDGTWYKHPSTNRTWSNYTTCIDTIDLAFRTKILNLYVIGNLISLVALSASLIIFISFTSLRCTRVTIHKNLFLSFIINNLMWIIWYTSVVNDADLLKKNPLHCRVWHVLLHYFLVSNYFWMFCEGLYLHTLLVVAFVSEDKILKWFYLLGWLIPIPITISYAYKRSYDEPYTQFCWMEESPHNLILSAPIGISLLLNLIFLINIVRVLVTKLRANNSPDAHQTRKAVRATLILIPLLGLHYILTPFRPETKSEWEGIYEIIAAVCTSFQGLCVAMLFCFCNGEVMAAIKKKLKDTFNLSQRNPKQSKMRSRSNTATTNCNYPQNNFIASSRTDSNQNSYSNSNNNNQLGHHSSQINLQTGKCSTSGPQTSNNMPTSNGIITNSTPQTTTNSKTSSLITNVTSLPIHSNSIEPNVDSHPELSVNNNNNLYTGSSIEKNNNLDSLIQVQSNNLTDNNQLDSLDETISLLQSSSQEKDYSFQDQFKPETMVEHRKLLSNKNENCNNVGTTSFSIKS